MLTKFEMRAKKLASQIKLLPRYISLIAEYSTDPEKNSVVPSMVVFYLFCMANGAYNTFVVIVPAQVLEKTLNDFQYDVFTWVTFIAPIVTLFGMCLHGNWAWTGALFQLCGNIGVFAILSSYIAALVTTQWWGQGNFGGSWVMAAATGSVVFIIRDIRRIADKDRWSDRGAD